MIFLCNIFIICISFVCFVGFGLGGLFGLFIVGVDFMFIMFIEIFIIRMVLKEMRVRFWFYGKNFVIVGVMFVGIECCLEIVSRYLFLIK